MESLLNRYRNITVLLLVIMAQLVLLAVDSKTQGVPLIRVWAVTAVTPVARVLEGLRGGGSGFLHNYILLHDTNAENRRLKAELDRLKMENIFLKNDLHTADRAKALEVFQSQTASKTVAATVIATGAGVNSRVVFVDRGSAAGVMRGMAVVTPDGIVGKVIAAYPVASEVLLITDPDFAAGVVSQKGGVRGTLKGQGTPQCRVEYVPSEDKIEPGELLFTSGDDRVFPRGFPVGVVKSVRPGQPFKEILVEPAGLQKGLQDVLILIHGVHQAIPDSPPAVQPMYIAPAPPSGETKNPEVAPASGGTEADRLRTQYKALGEAQNHIYGDNPPGAKAADFTKLGGATPAQPAGAGGSTTPAPKPGAGGSGAGGNTPAAQKSGATGQGPGAGSTALPPKPGVAGPGAGGSGAGGNTPTAPQKSGGAGQGSGAGSKAATPPPKPGGQIP